MFPAVNRKQSWRIQNSKCSHELVSQTWRTAGRICDHTLIINKLGFQDHIPFGMKNVSQREETLFNKVFEQFLGSSRNFGIALKFWTVYLPLPWRSKTMDRFIA